MFDSYFLAGFECSTQRRADGRRLDLTASSGHDRHAVADFERAARDGLRAARDGIRWHLVEPEPGRYDGSSFLPMLRAARGAGVTVIWDLCHYGWPDHLDVWSPAFANGFAAYAEACARMMRDEGESAPWFCPINEISFLAWAGGDMAQMNPGARGRGAELKRQLVRAALAGMEAVRAICPQARFITAEPLIHVDGGSGTRAHRAKAEAYRVSQFEVCDMLTGAREPELGGHAGGLDVVGVNFYPDNQWYHRGSTIPLGHHAYRPLRDMLREVFERYRHPILVSETGAEGTARPAWLHYVLSEVEAALMDGVPVEGVCLYPILDCPGWRDERLCPVGLYGTPGPDGARARYEPLATELARQRERLIEARRRAPSTALLRTREPTPIL